MIKQFLLILVLIFSLQSWIKADDIKDFEIEGMSIGDSLLDYVNENEINNNKIFRYNSNKYLQYNLELNNSQYDDLVIEFKNSGNYLIGSIIARIMYLDNDFYKCSSKEKVILSDLNNFLKKMQIILIMVLINMKQIKLENQKELGILFNLKMEVGGFIWSV